MKCYRSLIHVAAAAVVLSLVGVQEADANTARRDSLAGNRLIEDRNDVFAYPQLAPNYANRLGVDYGTDDQQGSALLIMGDQRAAFGVALHHASLFDNELFPHRDASERMGGPDDPLALNPGAFDYPTPGTVVDLFAGFDLGTGLAGARLAIGRANTTTQPDGDDDSSDSATFVMLQGGYSMSGPLVLDTSAKIVYAAGSETDTGDDQNDASAFSIAASGRGYADIDQPWELGFLADLDFDLLSATDTSGSEDLSGSGTGFAAQVGLGPVWNLDTAEPADAEPADAEPGELGEDEVVDEDGFETAIAGYAVLGYNRLGLDPDDDTNDDSASFSTMLLPGVHLAGDFALTDWLAFRTGAQYSWAIRSASIEGGTDQSQSGSVGDVVNDPDPFDPEDVMTGSPGGFSWSAGMGVKYGDFRFDGSFRQGFLTNGPNFIGGGSGFLAVASAEYTWE